jgi:predicted dehydrogenase
MPDVTRRDFLRSSAVAMAAASYSRVLGANDTIYLGVVGCGDRGRYDMKSFLTTNEVTITGLCDIYGQMIEKARALAPDAAAFKDHRKLLEAKNLDAVLVTTPDHWHAAVAIDALQAGKDVFCEKPLTLTIDEGPKIIKAARVNNRICQVGMQQRSGDHYILARDEYLRKHRLGKVTLARTWWHGNSYHVRTHPPELDRKPADLDWERYVEPVEWREYDPQQYFNFRAYLDFGGGQITDLFCHWIDVVHMLMDEDRPLSAASAGGVYHFKDGRTAPDTINVLMEYPGGWTSTFEATLAPGAVGAAVELLGTEGRLYITRAGFEFNPVVKRGEKPNPVSVKPAANMDVAHVQNFIDCMRSRKLPNADVAIGHRAAVPCHLGNMAYLQKRRLQFDPVREQLLL